MKQGAIFSGTLSAKRIVLYLGVPAGACAIMQLALGASPLTVLLAGCTVALGLLAFAALGAYNGGAWLVFFYVLGNVLIALIAKTFMGQTVDSHLYAAADSFSILLITTCGLVAATVLASATPVGRPVFMPTRNVRTLSWLCWGSFFLGIVFWLANQHFQGPRGSGFGGIAVFRGLLYMAVIARTAALLERSRGRRSFDIALGVIVGVSVFLGLLSDRKADVAYPVVAYFATILFYRRRLAWRHTLALVTGAFLFVLVLAPLIHVWRGLGQENMALGERITLVNRTARAILENGRLDYYLKKTSARVLPGYYDYFGSNGTGQRVLGRFASVQQIDPVVSETERQGTVGGSAIWPAFGRLLPGFVYPNKPKYIEGYHILVHFGLISPEGGKFPTVPLAGQVYAAYGLIGVLVIPFLTFLTFLLFFKKLGWSLYRNVYAVFFFVNFVIVYAAQGTFGQYAGAVLRDFPLLAATFWVLAVLARKTAPSARCAPADTQEASSFTWEG